MIRDIWSHVSLVKNNFEHRDHFERRIVSSETILRANKPDQKPIFSAYTPDQKRIQKFLMNFSPNSAGGSNHSLSADKIASKVVSDQMALFRSRIVGSEMTSVLNINLSFLRTSTWVLLTTISARNQYKFGKNHSR